MAHRPIALCFFIGHAPQFLPRLTKGAINHIYSNILFFINSHIFVRFAYQIEIQNIPHLAPLYCSTSWNPYDESPQVPRNQHPWKPIRHSKLSSTTQLDLVLNLQTKLKFIKHKDTFLWPWSSANIVDLSQKTFSVGYD